MLKFRKNYLVESPACRMIAQIFLMMADSIFFGSGVAQVKLPVQILCLGFFAENLGSGIEPVPRFWGWLAADLLFVISFFAVGLVLGGKGSPYSSHHNFRLAS